MQFTYCCLLVFILIELILNLLFPGQCSESAYPVRASANNRNIRRRHFRSGRGGIRDELRDRCFQHSERIPVGAHHYWSGWRFHLLLLRLVLQVQETNAPVDICSLIMRTQPSILC